MSDLRKIRSALISVFNKDGLGEILKILSQEGVCLYSTEGTQSFIEGLGFQCLPVESLTGYPSVLGGRVKTLHPKIFGGILSRRDCGTDKKQMKQYGIFDIDLVIVDLYPFQETLLSQLREEEEIIEKIDIGGISLIRAAAKNFKDVVVIASKKHYKVFLEILKERGAVSSVEERKWFAKEAFAVSSGYDMVIFNYFDSGKGTYFRQSGGDEDAKILRYGENPHQKGIFYGCFDASFEQLQGKEISYNNLLDISAAIDLMAEFSELTFAILKHNNACGVASRSTVNNALVAALAGDPVSAFGGVFICNGKVDKQTAEKILSVFFEIIIAPAYEREALDIFRQKKTRIILLQKDNPKASTQFRSLLNGVLVQDKNMSVQLNSDLKIVTKTQTASQEVIDDLLFANKIVKHTRSNAIVLAKNKQLYASGVGQTSRVDALKQAIEKARTFHFDLKGAVMASDAFFPFPDCVEIAHKAGIKAIIQPGGSVRDGLSIDYCNSNDLVMFTTGVRHFKH